MPLYKECHLCALVAPWLAIKLNDFINEPPEAINLLVGVNREEKRPIQVCPREVDWKESIW